MIYSLLFWVLRAVGLSVAAKPLRNIDEIQQELIADLRMIFQRFVATLNHIFMLELLQNAALGPGGVMYSNGNAVSGPLDSLIDLLIPAKCDEFDKVSP